MTCWVTGDANGEIITKQIANVPHKVRGVVEAVGGRMPVLAINRISSECQNVPYAHVFGTVEMLGHFRSTEIAARQVQHSFQSAVIQRRTGNRHGRCFSVTGWIARRMPCYVTKQWTRQSQPLESVEERKDYNGIIFSFARVSTLRMVNCGISGVDKRKFTHF